MVLEIKYVNANNPVIHTENLVTGILAKLAWDLGFGPNLGWELGFGTPLHDSHNSLEVTAPAKQAARECAREL